MKSILVRYDEITLKSSRKRVFFHQCMRRSLKDALRRAQESDAKIETFERRILIHCRNPDTVQQILSRVPGIHSTSCVDIFPVDHFDGLIEDLTRTTQAAVVGKVFAIRARRSGSHSFSSQDLARELGARLSPSSQGVDLSNPEVEIHVEVRLDRCFVYFAIQEGINGLPGPSGGKLLCLFSGGIDSPVAAYEMLKRGAHVNFLFFNLMGEKSYHQTISVYNYLIDHYAFGFVPKIYIFHLEEVVATLKEKVPSNMRQLALKILFYKIGERIAERSSHLALLTGEALSQKSTQTLHSLTFIEGQIQVPVLRPLIGFNKEQTLSIARKIGTEAYSKRVVEVCNLSDGPVITIPTASMIESIIDLDPLVDQAFEKIEKHQGIIDLPSMPLSRPVKELVNVVAIDMRYSNHRGADPLEGVIAIEEWEKSEKSKEKSYLLICEYGVRSEEIAFTLRKQGYRAAGVAKKDFAALKLLASQG